MAYLYLINKLDSKEYKIGVTKTDPNKRVKQLQTGSGSILQLINVFETETPYKLEKLMHLHYNSRKTEANNEWFVLEDEEVFEFKKLCEKRQETINYMLKHNCFYK